ncbi:MAG: hypothetical protein KIT09_30615 [Bryobacteraceae bacterium]|nr:hypothetical protein [Bryobacteraceae bacterium]
MRSLWWFLSRVLAVPLLAALLCAQSGLRAPRIGYVRDAGGAIRPLLGVRGNFLPGGPLFEGARAAAFSPGGGVVKTDEEVLILDAQQQVSAKLSAPAGDALFALDAGGAPAAAYFPQAAELYRFAGEELAKVECAALRPEDPVRAIAANAGGVILLAIERGEQLWMVSLRSKTGAIRSEVLLPGVSSALALLPGGAIAFADGAEAAVRRRDMSETRFPLAAPIGRLEPIGGEWVHLLSEDGRSWALRVSADSAELYRLPGGAR